MKIIEKPIGFSFAKQKWVQIFYVFICYLLFSATNVIQKNIFTQNASAQTNLFFLSTKILTKEISKLLDGGCLLLITIV